MSHEAGHVIIQSLSAPLIPADGDKPHSQAKVYHVILLALVVGFFLGLAV